MLCTSGFMDDVTFGRNGPYGVAWLAYVATSRQLRARPGWSLMSVNACSLSALFYWCDQVQYEYWVREINLDRRNDEFSVARGFLDVIREFRTDFSRLTASLVTELIFRPTSRIVLYVSLLDSMSPKPIATSSSAMTETPHDACTLQSSWGF